MKLLTVREAAKPLAVAPKTVHKFIKTGPHCSCYSKMAFLCFSHIPSAMQFMRIDP